MSAVSLSPAKGPSGVAESVRVAVRCRPLNDQERTDQRQSVIEMDTEVNSITITKPGVVPAHHFTFDAVFPPGTAQSAVYEKTALPIVENVLEGYNGTIFCYGQTGSGKSHTMVGPQSGTDPDLRGLIPRVFEHIFAAIRAYKNSKSTGGGEGDTDFLVHASYLEIYNEEVRDLLAKNPKETRLELRDRTDTGVYVKDLSTAFVENAEQIGKVLAHGQKNRSVGSTLMNQESSRSHSIFTITIETSTFSKVDNKRHIKVGKLNLVDLAGSERQSKTGSSGDQLKEATKINLSLSALGNVISALSDGKTDFIPYRDSKLTRLLQTSLGGNAKTFMVANVGPADYNFEESLSTLRYANRAKNIKNKPKINEDPKDAMIRGYQQEIEDLKKQLALVQQAGGSSVRGDRPSAGAGAGAGVGAGLGAGAGAGNEEGEEMEAQRRSREEEEREKQKTLVARLKSMEAKLLHGTEVLEQAAVQERELQVARRELEEKRILEQRMEQFVKEQEGERVMLEEKYESQADHIKKLTAKLEKLWKKHQEFQEETKARESEHQKERQDLGEMIRDANKDVSLYKLIVATFVPNTELNKLTQVAMFDEASESWRLPVTTTRRIAGAEPTASYDQRRPDSLTRSDRPRTRAPSARISSNTLDFEYPTAKLKDDLSVNEDMQRTLNSTFSLPNTRFFSLSSDGSLVREDTGFGGSGGLDGRLTARAGTPSSKQRPLTASRRGRPADSERPPSASMLRPPSSRMPAPPTEQIDASFPRVRGLTGRPN